MFSLSFHPQRHSLERVEQLPQDTSQNLIWCGCVFLACQTSFFNWYYSTMSQLTVSLLVQLVLEPKDPAFSKTGGLYSEHIAQVTHCDKVNICLRTPSKGEVVWNNQGVLFHLWNPKLAIALAVPNTLKVWVLQIISSFVSKKTNFSTKILPIVNLLEWR